MASAITKRQQARNERALQDLLRTVPGNSQCADCGTNNPGWASWNLGIFLCLRCAALHRKLGTHISKVKSLSMDAWQAEQVENMRKMGNAKSNAIYNPKNVRADIPIDADEVEGALERYIRQKYEARALMNGGRARQTAAAQRHDTGSTSGSAGGGSGWSDDPPPLPPKPGKKFGLNLRSSSMPFHRSRTQSQQQQQDHVTPPRSPTADSMGAGSTHKPSQVFGMRITTVSNNFDSKLAVLRDMGFADNKKNTEILKSTNGDVDRAVETLVRLGEGAPAMSHTAAPRTLTPVSMSSSGVNGLSVEKTRQAEGREPSNNPWEVRDDTPQRAATQPLPSTSNPVRAQSAGPDSNHSWNPFMNAQPPPQPPPQQHQSLESSMQSLQLSQAGSVQQPQFQQLAMHSSQAPQSYGAQQPMRSLHMQSTGPAQVWANQQPNNTFLPQQSLSQTVSPMTTGVQQQANNPFLRKSASQTFTPSSNPWASQTSTPPVPQIGNHWLQQQQRSQSPAPMALAHNNPFGLPQPQQQDMQSIFQQPNTASPAPMFGQQEYFQQQQTAPQFPQQTQFQQQQQQQPFQQAQQLQQPQQPFSAQPSNPWQQQTQQPQQTGFTQPQQQQQQQQQQAQQSFHQPTTLPQQQPQFQQPQQPFPSQPIRHDKTSILALYNTPGQFQQQRPLQTLAEDPSQQQQQAMTIPVSQQRSATMPMAMNGGVGTAANNPFATSMTNGQTFNNQNFSGQQAFPPMGAGQEFPPRTVATQSIGGHVSNESVDFVGLGGAGSASAGAMGNGSGRFSPDAFAGLSSRFVR